MQRRGATGAICMIPLELHMKATDFFKTRIYITEWHRKKGKGEREMASK